MSASQTRDNKIVPGDFKVSLRDQVNPGYTVRIICCVFLIFLTEIFLAHYVYRLIISDVRDNYLTKSDFRRHFQDEVRTETFREDVVKMLSHLPKSDQHASPTDDVISTAIDSRVKRSMDKSREYNFLSEESQVQFFHTREPLTHETDSNRRRSLKGGEADDNSKWVWLTSTSKIQENQLFGICQKIKEFCVQVPGPKGERGEPGLPGIEGGVGPTGSKGDPGPVGPPGKAGFPGVKGESGFPGMPGLQGFPGQKGEQGRPGLDGRIGIPGTPGLDGMPGRNGYDGIPGKDGSSGRDGKHGINGQKGEPGLPGIQGPPGQRGIAGPRGKPGRAGTNGTPGMPGVTAYKLGNKNVSELLIPPSIAGSHMGEMGPIVVHEGENVRLQCSATGTPIPRITWQKLDNRPINRGAWQDAQVSGAILNITRVNRDHMGKYLCIADNGIPPAANHTFNLEVYCEYRDVDF